MNHLRLGAACAVLTLALCILVAVDPVALANSILRRPFADRGDPAFTLFYRWVAIVGAMTSLYILAGDLWTLAHT